MDHNAGPTPTGEQPEPSRFEQSAREPQPGFVRELTVFLLENKKWWLAPILIAMLLLGVLIAIGGTGAAPFIYTLF